MTESRSEDARNLQCWRSAGGSKSSMEEDERTEVLRAMLTVAENELRAKVRHAGSCHEPDGHLPPTESTALHRMHRLSCCRR